MKITTKEQAESEMRACKIHMSNLDYKRDKWVDGAMTDEEYEPIRQKFAELRQKYNEMEELAATLPSEQETAAESTDK